jgi:hypothetical protein
VAYAERILTFLCPGGISEESEKNNQLMCGDSGEQINN